MSEYLFIVIIVFLLIFRSMLNLVVVINLLIKQVLNIRDSNTQEYDPDGTVCDI